MAENTKTRPVDLQSLVETHTKPFVVVDSSYRILAVNSAYEAAFEVSAAETIGKFCYRGGLSARQPLQTQQADLLRA